MTALLERLYPIPADLCWTKKQYQEFKRERMKAKLTVEYATPFIEQAWIAGPAGQGAVTAVLLHDLFGLPILKGAVRGKAHYYNNGADLTWKQWPSGSEIENIEVLSRWEVPAEGYNEFYEKFCNVLR